jgi:hypothetical protein
MVDMAANHGEGLVTRKAVRLTPHITRMVAATQHANRKDFWILTRDAVTRDYLAYLLTEKGLDFTPVQSPSRYIPDTVGQLRISADGTRLAVPAYTRVGGTELVECLARFDSRTGLVSSE